ncbi:MAG: GNAT family N-acetyltransferase [Planctomycetes bacterium]|nr:GNAT family N-acetyltransferase [Planctomycetota bacterium]
MSDFVKVVPAESRHYGEFVRLFPELGVDDPIPDFALWYERMAPDSLFLEEHGMVLAYAWFYALDDEGFVRHVIVDPTARGRGLGARLMHEIAQRLRQRGCSNWQLNVKPDNRPAVRLYRAYGMDTDYRTWVVRIARQSVAAFASPGSPAVELPANEDPHTEVEFDLPGGLLTKLRSGPDIRVLGVRAGARLRGVARFDPLFPGAFPFLARDDDAARGLLEAMLACTPPDKPWVQLVLERDARLAQALLDGGAWLMFEIHHMTGTIP